MNPSYAAAASSPYRHETAHHCEIGHEALVDEALVYSDPLRGRLIEAHLLSRNSWVGVTVARREDVVAAVASCPGLQVGSSRMDLANDR